MADYNPNQFDRPAKSIPDMTVVNWDDHEEWCALYVNGKLQSVGDRYLIDEEIAELAGVKYLEADFLVGKQHRDAAPSTLTELLEYHNKTEVLRKEAEAKRAEAEELLRRAAELIEEADSYGN